MSVYKKTGQRAKENENLRKIKDKEISVYFQKKEGEDEEKKVEEDS